MPRVQNYSGQRVEAKPLPGVRLTAAPTGEATAAAGAAISRIGAEIYADEVRKQDEIAVLEADRKMSEWETRRLYDPKEGALTRRGKDAFGLPDTVGKELDDTVGQIRNSLTNDRQRMAFDRRATARRSDITTTLSRHVFGEVRKHDDAETESYLANAQQAAIVNYANPERVSLEIERQRAAVIDYANRNGLGAEYVKQKVAQVHSNTHVGVIDRMLANGQDQGAKGYFDKVRGEIAGDDVTKVEAKLLTATTEGAGLRSADEVWKAQGPKSDLDPVNIDKMAEDLKAKHAAEPGVLKSALAALKERAALHNVAQKERADAMSGTVWRAVSQGATLAQITRSPEFLAMPGQQQEQVRAYMVREAEHRTDRAYMLDQRRRAAEDRAEGDATKGNFAEYLRLSDPTTLAGMSRDQVTSLLPRLGRTLTGQIVAKWETLAKGADAVRDAKIDEDQFKQLASTSLPHVYKSTREDDKATLGRLKDAVETAIAAEERATKKPATRERKGQIMQELLDQKVKVDVWGRDPEKPAAIVKTDERDKVYVPVDRIPKSAASDYLNWLRSKGHVAAGMSDAQAMQRFGPRIERAYGARLIGASREQIEQILQDK